MTRTFYRTSEDLQKSPMLEDGGCPAFEPLRPKYSEPLDFTPTLEEKPTACPNPNSNHDPRRNPGRNRARPFVIITRHVSTVKTVVRPFYQKKRWISLCVLLSIALIAVVTYLLYHTYDIPTKRDEIMQRYGSMFRTREEQQRLEESLRDKLIPIREKPDIVKEDQQCSFQCAAPHNVNNSKWTGSVAGIPWSERQTAGSKFSSNSTSFLLPNSSSLEEELEEGSVGRSTDGRQYSYHGCCISHTEFFSPGRLKNRDDQWRRVVQFRNERQYFARDICRHADNCSGCTCKGTLTYNTAVVIDYDGDDGDDDDLNEDNVGRVVEGEEEMQNFRLELVKMDGACKCFNN